MANRGKPLCLFVLHQISLVVCVVLSAVRFCLSDAYVSLSQAGEALRVTGT